MPNHITTELTIEGKTKDVRELFNTVKREETEFDFNTIIPMPESLGIDSVSSAEMAAENELRKSGRLPQTASHVLTAALHEATLGDATSLEFLETDMQILAIKMIQNYLDHGHMHWYSWCSDNWDTKWNAYSIKRKSNNCISFQTAWTCPTPIIIMLSSMFPSTKIYFKYADEDVGSNAGFGIAQHGLFEITKLDGKEAAKLYYELTGYDPKADGYDEDFSHKQKCRACDGSGQNPETKQIADDWYDFEGTDRRWRNDITQDEVDALIEGGRLRDFTHTWNKDDGWHPIEPKPVIPAQMINEWSSGKSMGHDSINHWICTETRAKRLGVWGKCLVCGGEGEVWPEGYKKPIEAV